MIAKPPHKRRLGLVEASLTKTRLKKKWGSKLDDLRDQIESKMISSGYLDGAPFWWVTLAIRHGLKYDSEPTYEPIDQKFGDLPLGIEIDVRDLLEADDKKIEAIFSEAVLISLIHAGRRYDRPTAELEAMLEKVKSRI